MTRRRWTVDEDTKLRQMHTDGWSMQSVMLELNRSREAVRIRSYNMGLRWGREQRKASTSTLLEREIAQARKEMSTTPLFRPGNRL